MDKITFGNRIRESRKKKGYTGEQTAEKINISAAYFRQIECGKANKSPSLPVFIDICNTLSVSPDYLLQDQLSSSEINQIRELEKFWQNMPPEENAIALSIIKKALEYNNNDQTDHSDQIEQSDQPLLPEN